MSKKREVIDTNVYKKRLSKIHDHIFVKGEYKTLRKKILHHCNKHNIDFYSSPELMLRGGGCAECKKEKRIVSNDDFKKRINKNIIMISRYNGLKNKVTVKCLISNCTWDAYPASLLRGGCCKDCQSKKSSKDHTKYVEELRVISPHIDVIEEYDGDKKKIIHRCNKSNLEWRISPNSTLRGTCCKQCNIERLKKSNDEYIKEVLSIRNDIEVIGVYDGCQTKIKHRCLTHNHTWETTPNHILSMGGCKYCKIISKGERSIKKILEDNNIEFEYQFSPKWISPKSFDFCVGNKIIEYDGKHHFEFVKHFHRTVDNFKQRQELDILKEEKAKSMGYSVIRISYLEYDNIYKILKNEFCF